MEEVKNWELIIVLVSSVIAAIILITVAVSAATTADTKAAATTLEAMTRRPELKTPLLTTMLISVGLIESIPIIAAVIAIVLILANPFLDAFL